MTEAHPQGIVETYSPDLIDHVRQHATDLYPLLMKKKPGGYHGRIECCDISWRAKVTEHGPKRTRHLTVSFIDIHLPDGVMLFAW